MVQLGKQQDFFYAGSAWRNTKDDVDSLHTAFTNKISQKLV